MYANEKYPHKRESVDLEPAICLWDSDTLKDKEKEELEDGGFGKFKNEDGQIPPVVETNPSPNKRFTKSMIKKRMSFAGEGKCFRI